MKNTDAPLSLIAFIAVLYLVSIILIPFVSSEPPHLQTFFKSEIQSYEVQWQRNFGSDWSGGRYQGPQPIGDCDNDGENEWLIGGRDATLRVMEWGKEEQTYEETHALHSPFYFFFKIKEQLTGREPPHAGGFAIGDITGDGENEIAATWYAAVYKYIGDQYQLIGMNSYIFSNGGGNGDCYIGDCTNDGTNELIMAGGGGTRTNPVPEIVIMKWNGMYLEKIATYDDPIFGYAFAVGLGDPDGDDENEIVCCITNYNHDVFEGHKVIVLDWNTTTSSFDATEICELPKQDDWPFGGWCADSDLDGIDEIHVGYLTPKISIFEWNGTAYTTKFEQEWPGEGMLIEGLDIGDIDGDGIPEVCASTDDVHILQWNGETYVEEACITETYGDLAVLNIGDCDNDGALEMNVAPVFVDTGEDYISWMFQYSME